MFAFPKQNLGESTVYTFSQVSSLREPKVLKFTFTKTQGSISIHDIHFAHGIGLQFFADTMKFWPLFSSFVRQGEKKNFKILSLWWIPIFRITRWNPELNNYLPWHRALRVAPLFFTWDYTLRFLQQRLCTASETHIFTRWCVEPSSKHIYTAEILNIPPRASKWKFCPVTA